MKIRIVLFCAVVLLVISACSSLPKHMEPQEKQNADNFLAQAYRFELQRDYAKAVPMYEHANKLYNLLSDPNGVMESYSGLARIAYLNQDQNTYQDIRNNMQVLNLNLYSQNCHHMVLLDLFVLHKESNWRDIVNTAIVKDDFPPTGKMQILSYKVQGNSYQKINDPGSVRDLQKLYKRLKTYPSTPSQISSQAAYSLAYHHFNAAEYDNALRYVEEAFQIDYASGNSENMGYDLVLKAKIQRKTNDIIGAKQSLTRAMMVFEAIADAELTKSIRAELESF